MNTQTKDQDKPQETQNHDQPVDESGHVHGPNCNHHHNKLAPIVREIPKVGRNDDCPCGSENKYKKCCGK